MVNMLRENKERKTKHENVTVMMVDGAKDYERF